MKLQRFFVELKRRKVFRVLGMYAVGAWAVVEVSATTFPLLGLPEWTVRGIVVLALLGLPVAMMLAWTFDLTAKGVVRTPDMPETPGGATPPPAPATAARGLGGRAAGFFGLGMLVALVTVAAYFRFAPPPGVEGIESIAVLPFADMSAAQDQEYFSDGITEELLDRLAHVEGLRVAARTSSFAFKGTNEDVREIARRLGVESVLEGSVRREGPQLRVTAQLIDARTGYHLWSETYDRESTSVFAIQDEIANAIVSALRKQFVTASLAPTRRSTSVRAHDLYLRALAGLHYRSEESVRQAITFFEQAIEEDPEYAPAHAGLAQAWAVLPSLGSTPVSEAVAKGSAAAARALALDAGLAEAHAALGQIAQGFEWDLNSAERAYRRALTFNADYATAHQWYGETLMMLGRYDEAQREIDTALELDPLSPAAMTVRAYLHAVRGETETALELFRSITGRYADHRLALLNQVLLAVQLGRTDDVRTAAGPLVNGDSALVDAMISIAASRSGTGAGVPPAALAALDGAFPPAVSALFFAASGNGDQAIDRLRRAVEARADSNVPFILLHPLFMDIRGREDFREVGEVVGVSVH